MGERGRDLAARFRQALEAAEHERLEREKEQAQRLAEGRKEREDLLDDLAAFGQAIGHLAVQRHEGGVTFRHGDRYLHFEPMGEGERLRIEFEGIGDEEHRLYREPELGSKWVWLLRRKGREDRLPLFDAGLEELLVLALKLPKPGHAVAVAPQPTMDDLVPAKKTDDGKRSL